MGKVFSFLLVLSKNGILDTKDGGIDAITPKTRCDINIPRVLRQDAIYQIHKIKEKYPYITGKLVYQKLVEEGFIKSSETSLATVLRYIRENNLKANQLSGVVRKAYEMEYANDCWQSDTSHGPVITVNGKKKQTYLITFIDDASRLILHGEFFFNDNAVNMQTIFKKAISKYGVPKRIFVDNGGTYKNDQLRLICASLGVVLIHTKAYSPESKGKIERSFRTIKDNWLNGADWNIFTGLEDLNTQFNKYLNEKYSNSIHSAIGLSPRNRYLKDMNRIKFIPKEKLEDYFLHRVTRKVNNDATIQLHSKFFEVPQKYIGRHVNVRYSPTNLDIAYIFNENNVMVETVYPLKRVDNSKIKRTSINYTSIAGGKA